ncbi:hypothetical protein JCM9957A_37190 [Kineosporia succinea]
MKAQVAAAVVTVPPSELAGAASALPDVSGVKASPATITETPPSLLNMPVTVGAYCDVRTAFAAVSPELLTPPPVCQGLDAHHHRDHAGGFVRPLR